MSLLAPVRAALTPPRGRRVSQLLAGLVLYGVSDAMMLRAGLGVDPWDVLQQGLSRRVGLAVGTWTVIVGVAVLLLWVPLRQRPGLGTVLNVIVIGVVIDLVMATFGPADGVVWRATVLVSGVALNGVATATYIGAGLGPGPRDGLMTGIAARGPSIRVTRTTIEVTVLATGWLLGGTVGLGTVLYALSIGPVTQWLLPWTTVGAGPASTAAPKIASATRHASGPHHDRGGAYFERLRAKASRGFAAARRIYSDIDYAQTRLLETRTRLELTPETARRRARTEIAALEAADERATRPDVERSETRRR